MIAFILMAALFFGISEAVAQGVPGISGVNVMVTPAFISKDEGGAVITVTADRAANFIFGVLVPWPDIARLIPVKMFFDIRSPEGTVVFVRQTWNQFAVDVSVAGESRVWSGLSVGGSVTGPGITVTAVRIPFKNLDLLSSASVTTITIIAEIGMDANNSVHYRREIRIADIPRKPGAATAPNRPQNIPPLPSGGNRERT